MSKMSRWWAVYSAFALVSWAAVSHGAVSSTVGIEGRLLSQAGGPVADGQYQVTFALYGSPTAQAASWTETVKVSVAGGRFQHALGSLTPLSPAVIELTQGSWLGVKVASDPELPRAELRAVAFAVRAAVAEQATDLVCSGCVGSSELKFDGDVDLGAFSIKAKNGVFSGSLLASAVTAQSITGDGSKLTNVQIAGGTCKAGEVVTAVKPDGSVVCGQGGGGSALLGGKVTDTFTELGKTATLPVNIPDNTGAVASVQASFGKVGNANTLSVKVALTNTDLSTLQLKLFPPDDKKTGLTLCDPCGAKDAKSLAQTYTPSSTLKAGSLKDYVGKSVEGIWTLQALDSSFCVGQIAANKGICDVDKKLDGKVTTFEVSAAVTSSQSVKLGGTLQLALLAASPFPCEPARKGHVYFDTKVNKLRVCDGSAWATAGHRCGDSVVDADEECDDGNNVSGDGCDEVCKYDAGKSKAGAVASCAVMLSKVANAPSGLYWIDPDGGDTSNAFQVWCDTQAADGPWTLVMRLSKTSAWGYSHSVWTAADGGAGQVPDPAKNQDAVSPAFYKQQASSTRMCMRKYDDGAWVCETITHNKNTARNLANGPAPPSSQGTNKLLTAKWKSITAGGVWGAWAWHRFGWGALQSVGCGGIRLGFSADNDSSDSRDAGIGFGLLTQVACQGGTQRGAGYWQYPWSPQPNPAEASLEGQIWIK